MHFSGIPEISAKNNLNDLMENGLVFEGTGDKGTRLMYSLTRDGTKYYNTNYSLVPKAFKINYLDLAPAIKENFISIIAELKDSPKTTSQLVDRLDFTVNELNTYMIFLQTQEYVEQDLIDDIIYYVLIEEDEE
jgi:DNA-binding PadR family transcriptional regulator